MSGTKRVTGVRIRSRGRMRALPPAFEGAPHGAAKLVRRAPNMAMTMTMGDDANDDDDDGDDTADGGDDDWWQW